MTFSLMRLKYVAAINQWALPEDTDPGRPLRYIDISSVGRGELLAEPEPVTFAEAPSRARRLVRDGDTIISTVRTYLRAVLPIRKPHPDTVVSTGFAVLTPRPPMDYRYFAWTLESDAFVEEVVARSVGVSYPAVNAGDLGDIRIPLPDLAQQRAIATYLDTETARIDALIVRKQRIGGLLEERRQGTIVASVTGQFSSSPSGLRTIDVGWWSGPTPEHWQVGRLKDLVEVTNGFPFDSSRFSDVRGMPVVRIRDLVRGQTQTYFDGDVPPDVVVEDGDLLVGMDGDFTTAVWHGGRAALNQRLCRLRAREGLDQRFLRHVIDLPLRYINDLTYATTVKHLSSTELLSKRLPLPPVDEQRLIADLLDRETSRIDTARDALARQIALFREHRQALITTAVTGELDIPGAAA